ncbi:protein-serine O-palmitoleoyltransferase porcupine-like isoform X2 [Artemia franciscana]|uniref:protein-serine O-palmitoleoyltransferase porcupine-like isoform X2 n=1 Tax=Artemia franciscana TaxID=6661 RepID=UPI0032DAF576
MLTVTKIVQAKWNCAKLLGTVSCAEELCHVWRNYATRLVLREFHQLVVNGELFIVASQDWHTIRGAQMLISMKVISIGFDIDSNHLLSVPMPMDFFGYIFCVGTIIFGPWTRFSDYAMIGHNKLGIIHNILVTSWKSAVALFFLSISTCWSFWIAPNGSYKWSVAYRDALSFRSSHYFVSKMAEASSLTCNILQSKVKGAKKDDKKYENDSVSAEPIVITRPWSIELPRSLVEVVVHWNIPMHHWLRTYVFKNTRSLGTLPAILSTYAASAMLHGLNFQLAAVLFSLGIYTYTEHIFRTKLAFMINGCVGPRKCSDCTHALKESHFVVMIINFCFSLIVMFHLAYLGFTFNSAGSMEEEGYSMYHTLEKWRWLNFSSHWVVLFTFILASVM